MKNLLIIRHAKSSWDDPYLDDHKRPLARRGNKDLPVMAERLKALNIYPDAIIASDAVRAKTTALLLAQHLGSPTIQLEFTRDLFHASAHTVIELVKKSPDRYQTLGIVGHNPGLNDLIWNLDGDIDNLPTSGIYGLSFSTSSWATISPKNVSFWFYDYPKKDK